MSAEFRWIACLPALALLGCSVVEMPKPDPEPVPKHWHQAVSQSTAPQAPADWWRPLGDPMLDRLLARALEANGDIAQAAARILQARALLAGAQANLQPSLTAGAGVDRVRIPAFRQAGQNLPVDNATWPYAGFAASYEIDLFERLAKAAESAEGELKASEFDRLQVHQSVILETLRAYADLRHAQRRIATAAERSALADELALLERRRLHAGLSTWRFVNEAERDAEAIRLAAIQAERDRQTTLARLALLVNRPVSETLAPRRLDDQLFVTELAVEAGLPASVVERRPDVQAAWHRLLASTTDIERAELERYPSITLTGILGIASSGFSGWLAKDALGWIAGAAANTPLFDGGRIQSQVDRAAAARDERRAAYRKAVYTALTEVESALAGWQAALDALDSSRKQLRLRQRDADNGRQALELGRNSRIDTLLLRLAEAEAGETVDAALHQRLIAYASVQKALAR